MLPDHLKPRPLPEAGPPTFVIFWPWPLLGKAPDGQYTPVLMSRN